MAKLIQMVGEDHYNVAVVPDDFEDFVQTIKNDIRETWGEVDSNTKIELIRSGKVFNVVIDGNDDEDAYVVTDIKMVGF